MVVVTTGYKDEIAGSFNKNSLIIFKYIFKIAFLSHLKHRSKGKSCKIYLYIEIYEIAIKILKCIVSSKVIQAKHIFF